MRRAPLRLQVATARLGVVVDAEVFGLSPYGGLIEYWRQLLIGLTRAGIPIELHRPPRLRASLPDLPAPGPADAWVFHPTYLGEPPRPVDALAYTVHDTIYEDFPETAAALDPDREARRRQHERVRRADVLLVPSRSTLDGVHRHFPGCGANAHVTGEGADRRFAAPLAPGAARALRGRLEAAGCRRPYLLHVGGRRHYKNFTFLLSAYAHSGLAADFDLVVAGSEPHLFTDEREILDRGSSLARVGLLGHLSFDELAAAYRGAQALVAPSLAEGFGLPAVEATVSGTPVAHARLAVYDETLAGHGAAFDPHSLAECRDAIRIIVGRVEADRASAASAALARHDWSAAVERTLSAYTEAVSALGR